MVPSNAPADGAVSLAATNSPAGLNSAFIVHFTRAVGGMKLAHLIALMSLIGSTVKPLASIERPWNVAVCPGRNSTSEGIICNDLDGPGAGHFSATASPGKPVLFPF